MHVNGEAAVLRQRHDVKLVLTHGRAFSTEGLTFETMSPSQCHLNVAKLFEMGRGRIGMGWGLSDDGLWREHSWIVSTECKRTRQSRRDDPAATGVYRSRVGICRSEALYPEGAWSRMLRMAARRKFDRGACSSWQLTRA